MCDYDTCCPRSRALVAENLNVLEGHDKPEFRAYAQKCGAYEYEGSVYVNTHIYAVASPMKKAVDAGCPFVVAHAIFRRGNPTTKEMIIWKDKDEGESFFKEGSLSMGTFQFSEIARAYEAASPNAAGFDAYDIMGNNCGTFVINLALELGVRINAQTISFVTHRLLKGSGRKITNSIRSNPAYFLLFPGRRLHADDSMTNEQLIELLVERSASALFV